MIKKENDTFCMRLACGLVVYYNKEIYGSNSFSYKHDNIPDLVKCPVPVVSFELIDNDMRNFEIWVANSVHVDHRNDYVMRADKVIGGSIVFWIDFNTGVKGEDIDSLTTWLEGRIKTDTLLSILAEPLM